MFPFEGNHLEKGSFQDGNPMEICCKLVVSLMFPLKGTPFFHPVYVRFMHCDEYGDLRTWNICNESKTVNRDRSRD